jgi:hypothetical protein
VGTSELAAKSNKRTANFRSRQGGIAVPALSSFKTLSGNDRYLAHANLNSRHDGRFWHCHRCAGTGSAVDGAWPATDAIRQAAAGGSGQRHQDPRLRRIRLCGATGNARCFRASARASRSEQQPDDDRFGRWYEWRPGFRDQPHATLVNPDDLFGERRLNQNGRRSLCGPPDRKMLCRTEMRQPRCCMCITTEAADFLPRESTASRRPVRYVRLLHQISARRAPTIPKYCGTNSSTVD